MEHDDNRPARRRPSVQQPVLRCGRFADTATDENDLLRVVCRDFDDRQFFDIDVWMPRVDVAGPVFPAAGDLAFIQEVRSDDYAGWICVAWHPAS
jgi:hypothetical protein